MDSRLHAANLRIVLLSQGRNGDDDAATLQAWLAMSNASLEECANNVAWIWR